MAIQKNDPNPQVSKSDPTLQHQQPENPAPGVAQGSAPAPAGGPPITNVNTTPENAPAGGTGGQHGPDRTRGEEAKSSPDAQRAQLDQARVRENARLGEMRHRAEQAKRKAAESRNAADKASEEARRLAAQANADAEAAERLTAAADPEKAVYVVAEGKSLFTLSGTKGAFDRVKARDFAGGYDELNEHVRAGDVVPRD